MIAVIESIYKNIISKLSKTFISPTNVAQMIVLAVVIGAIGAWFLAGTQAGTPTISIEPENGALTTLASGITDASASSSGAVRFSASASPGSAANGLLTSDPNFFPIAVWLQTPESNAVAYKNIGINTFVGLYNGTTASSMTAIKNAGLYIANDQDATGLNNVNANSVMKAWLQPDEPDNAQDNGHGGYDPCLPVSGLQATYNNWKAADAIHRPVLLGFGRGVSDINWVGRGTCSGDTQYYRDAKTAADIFAFDVYPVNGGTALEDVAKGVDNLRGWVGSSGNYRPVWADIETTKFGNTQGPTPAQTKFEVWSAIIHGARGIDYFCHIFSPNFIEAGLLNDSNMSAAVMAINTQIRSVAAVLNTGTPISNNVISSAGASAPVDTLTLTYDGSTYIFAADMRNKATTVTYKPAGVTTGTITVLGESRSIPLSSGSFSDIFTGYSTHIYKIN